MKSPEFLIGDRMVGSAYPPLVIAEIGINHEGDISKALRMIDDAAAAGCECVKIQTHIVEAEMIQNDVIPGNTNEPIWNIISRCSLTVQEEALAKAYTEENGMIFLSTPFSREAADRLATLDVVAYKVGSGECNNYPLIGHIAALGRPVIVSTGMNDIKSVRGAVEILRDAGVPFALLHCTSLYPTPNNLVRLSAIRELADAFPDAVVGLSDHSTSIYPALGAVSLGASILERHFTSDRTWPGPDIDVSMVPEELAQLVVGSRAIFESLLGGKEILGEEAPTIRFAYASVVSLRDIVEGAELSVSNIWVKRPGTGGILAPEFFKVLGRRAARPIARDSQLGWDDIVP